MSCYPDARLPEESVYHNVQTTRGRNVIFDIPGSSNIGCGAATSDNPASNAGAPDGMLGEIRGAI
ncbi:hypothetical protein C5167_018156, partial [Papaver somniferum]